MEKNKLWTSVVSSTRENRSIVLKYSSKVWKNFPKYPALWSSGLFAYLQQSYWWMIGMRNETWLVRLKTRIKECSAILEIGRFFNYSSNVGHREVLDNGACRICVDLEEAPIVFARRAVVPWTLTRPTQQSIEVEQPHNARVGLRHVLLQRR